MQLFYGVEGNYIDITSTVLKFFIHDSCLHIPIDDNLRSKIFGDPCYGTYKHIKLIINDKIQIYFPDAEIKINVDHEDSKEYHPLIKY